MHDKYSRTTRHRLIAQATNEGPHDNEAEKAGARELRTNDGRDRRPDGRADETNNEQRNETRRRGMIDGTTDRTAGTNERPSRTDLAPSGPLGRTDGRD